MSLSVWDIFKYFYTWKWAIALFTFICFFFAGWYVDSHLSKAYNFDSPVNNDITLYTKWIRK